MRLCLSCLGLRPMRTFVLRSSEWWAAPSKVPLTRLRQGYVLSLPITEQQNGGACDASTGTHTLQARTQTQGNMKHTKNEG